MPSLDLQTHHFTPESRAYLVDCHACSEKFDALGADWCSCIVKERSLTCPACAHCFCRADVEYKRRFWTEAPEALWDRKQRQARDRWALPQNAAPETLARPLVLVVDDDREVRAMALQLIDSWACGSIHAADGAEALALAHSYKPDVILTDALMPKMDGRELCRMVKSSPDLAATKVIIMSSVYTAGRFKREALSHFKADEFVSKPIDAKRLHRLVCGEAPADAPPADEAWVRSESETMAIAEPATHLSLVSEESTVAVAPAIADLAPAVDAVDRLEDDIQTETVVADAQSAPPPLPISATQLIYLRALGLDGEIAALAKQLPRFAARDLIMLRSAGIPRDFLRAVADRDTSVTPHQVVALFSTGCDIETIDELRRMHFSAQDIISVMAAEVPLSFVRDVNGMTASRLTPMEILRLHASGIDVEFLRALDDNGYGDGSADEWIGLWAAGVPAEFVRTTARLLAERCSAAELLRLWLTGVDTELFGEISASA